MGGSSGGWLRLIRDLEIKTSSTTDFLTKDGIETIEQALADAYLINPVLNAERARLRATDEQVALAKSGLRPFISASGDTAFILKLLILFGLLRAQLRAEPGCRVHPRGRPRPAALSPQSQPSLAERSQSNPF